MTQYTLSFFSNHYSEPNIWDIIDHVLIHWDYENKFGHWEGLGIMDKWLYDLLEDEIGSSFCRWTVHPSYCYRSEFHGWI